jgi:hypothetical protein
MRDLLNASGVGACHRAFRFTPPADRKQGFSGSPFGGIDGNDIDIAVKAPVLKAVVENEYVSEITLFGGKARFVSITPDDNWNIAEAPFH